MTTPNHPDIQGISHIALSVDDLPAALQFWTEVMGFEITTQTPTLGFVVHRASRIGIALTNNDHAVSGPFDEKHCGLDHLAFAVADLETLRSWRTRLVGGGFENAAIVVSGGGLHLNLLAPGGTPIEFYVMDQATAEAFGLESTDQAYAGSSQSGSR